MALVTDADVGAGSWGLAQSRPSKGQKQNRNPGLALSHSRLQRHPQHTFSPLPSSVLVHLSLFLDGQTMVQRLIVCPGSPTRGDGATKQIVPK